MTTLDTPNNIEVLLHCHCAASPHPRIEADAVKDAIAGLLECGAIELENGVDMYRTTPLGRAWINALVRVPIPRMAFIDCDGTVLG